MFNFIAGIVCVIAAILLWKAFKRWRDTRREAEFVRESLEPGAGLDSGVEQSVQASPNFSSFWDFLWGAALVVALLVFAFGIVVRISH